MTFCSFSIISIIITTIYLDIIFNPSHGFVVIQPEYRKVNPDKTATISCKHNESDCTVEDVRLNSIPREGKVSMLCQKGMTDCKNIFLNYESDKYTFVLLNLGPEHMNVTYECEITLKKNGIYDMEKGRPTRLLPGQEETEHPCRPPITPPPPPPPPSPPSPPPPPPPNPQSHLVRWILIGLLTLTFLYSCVITSLYIRLMNSDDHEECENSTYVEMRKAHPQRNAGISAYSG